MDTLFLFERQVRREIMFHCKRQVVVEALTDQMKETAVELPFNL
jgi:hypothetical protein